MSAVLNRDEWAQHTWERITPDYFTGPLRLAAEAAYTAYQKEKTCEPNVVMATLITLGYARRFDGSELMSLYEQGFSMSDQAFRMLVSQLEEEEQRRNVMALSGRLAQVAATPSTDFHVEVSSIAAEIATAAQTRQSDPTEGTLTVQQLLDLDFPQAGEVIPGLFKRRTRVVLTGPEGRGKSEMLFQIALCAARGIHPFTWQPIPAQRVLVVDAENEHVDLQRRISRISGLLDGMEADLPGDNMRIQDALGWNLLDSRDAGHLFALVRSYMPDLMIIGPVYQIMGGDANDAETVRRFMRVVDECRAISETAVLTEAHAGHGEGGNRNNWRPSGSSLWLRWPDMGIGMAPQEDSQGMELVRWRGDRVENEWPRFVTRGSILPWQEDV
jgi:replicative DNA helicase